MAASGDALDDNFVAGDASVDGSDSESLASDGEEAGGLSLMSRAGAEGRAATHSASEGRKRQRSAEPETAKPVSGGGAEESGAAGGDSDGEEEEDPEKQARKRARGKMLREMFQRKKEAKRADAASDTPGSSIQCQSGSVQCDYLWEWYLGGKGAQMSALEMQDRPLPQQFITMKGSRTELAALPPLIERHLPKCKKLFQFNKMARQPRGAPYVLIVCSSAIRCVNFLKHLARFRANCVKLFAKHIKTSEQKQALTMFTPIGVGTPARIHSLAQAGVLSLDHLRLLVVDVAADAKKRTLFDMKDVQEAWGELYHAHLHHALTTPFSTKGDAAVPPPTARPRARQAGEGAERTGAEGRPIAVLY